MTLLRMPPSHDENDSVKFKGLADEIVGKQKVLEKLLSSLPSVPGVVEDEELEERLKRLREDEPEAIKVEDEFLEYKAFVEKSMTPIQAKNEIIIEESRTKDPAEQDIKRKPADVLDTTEAVVKETIPTRFDNDAFDAKQEFNNWFENELAKKKRKPEPVEVLANTLAPATEVPAEDIFMNKVQENLEHKQKKSPDHHASMFCLACCNVQDFE